MNRLAEFINAMEAAMGAGVAGGNVVAVVGKMLARRQPGRLADNLFTLDDELGAVGILNHPFAAEQGDDSVGLVLDRDEIDERVRLSFRQAVAAMMVDEPVKVSREARNFAGRVSHA